jgi:hypothetical protein
MGLGTESAMLNHLKKAQGETNDRLESLLAEPRRTNELLGQLAGALSAAGRTPAG